MTKYLLILLFAAGIGMLSYAYIDTNREEEEKKACDGGDVDGCYNLGQMYIFGIGVKQNYFKAVKIYKKACDEGYAMECSNLGDMYVIGQGVKRDIFKAKEFYGKACDGGYTYGCKSYATLNK